MAILSFEYFVPNLLGVLASNWSGLTDYRCDLTKLHPYLLLQLYIQYFGHNWFTIVPGTSRFLQSLMSEYYKCESRFILLFTMLSRVNYSTGRHEKEDAKKNKGFLYPEVQWMYYESDLNSYVQWIEPAVFRSKEYTRSQNGTGALLKSNNISSCPIDSQWAFSKQTIRNYPSILLLTTYS